MATFKYGDVVKLVKKCLFAPPESNVWLSSMDYYIGETILVLDHDMTRGVHCDTLDGNSWYFPSQSLELVKKQTVADICRDVFGSK